MLRVTLQVFGWASIPLLVILTSAICSDLATTHTFADENDSLHLLAYVEQLAQDILYQEEKNAQLAPDTGSTGSYIVIDTERNRLSLCQGDRVLREMVCSTGSGKTLTYRWQTWRFSTPLGRFKVEKKEEGPVWIKPVWAFVEDNEPVPALPEAFERFEPGVLGEYALHFADGYMIHGTLYENRLGQSITHGCVRLGRKDLQYLYTHTEIGTPIYIY